MRTRTLADVCSLLTDGTHYTPPDVGAGVPFLTVKDVTDSALDFMHSSRISPDEYRKADAGHSAPRLGDVLFSKDGTVGKVHVVRTDQPFAVLSSLAILRPDAKQIDSGYLGHALRTPMVVGQATERKTGSAIRRIVLSDLKQLSFPVPRLEEQRRIAAILDQADGLRAKRREALAHLDHLAESIFLEMFGDPVTNPLGWSRATLGSLLANIDSGHSPVCLARPALADEWAVLKLGAVTYCRYDPTENKALRPETVPRGSHEVKVGDLLFARKNTRDLVGATALVRSTPPRMLLPDLIFRLQLREDAPVDKTFLHQLMTWPTKRRQIQTLANGSAGSMPNISKARLQTAVIETPPMSMQLEFARRVRSAEGLRESQHRQTAELNDLFASLQSRAFTGEL